PAAARPKTLSISDIATLITDPYAIYARKILNIRELDPLDEESDQSLFGEIVHAGLAAFFTDKNACAKPGAAAVLTHALHVAMREKRPRPALEHWWAARLARIADWIVETEQARRAENGIPLELVHEKAGEMYLPGGYTLKGRADRIELGASGVSIIDYKTGTPPSGEKVKAGTAPQLPLEAVMAEAGAFGPEFQTSVTELAYLRLSGRAEAGDERTLFAKKPDILREVIDSAAAALPALFETFADPATPYLAAPHPARRNDYDSYAGISRRAEWAGEDEPNDGD
ncbi:MAG: PD-(D/E)XK nuclease family protein, partial [Acidocella sp.]|nr:PD-(D/E)XK nuclease family protein [Acidocella sp.]